MHCLQFLLFFMFILIFSLTGTVDKSEAQRLGIGLTGGINAGSSLQDFQYVSGDIDLGLSPKIAVGFNAGVLVRGVLTQSLRLQAEPSLAILSTRYNESITLNESIFQTTSKTELIYVQLPLLLQLTTVPPERNIYGREMSETTYHLTAGVFGGYLLDGRFTGVNTTEPTENQIESRFSNDITGQVSEYDAGVILGGGLEHGLRSKIGLEARIHFSLLDSRKSNQYDIIPNNLALSLAVYYLF